MVASDDNLVEWAFALEGGFDRAQAGEISVDV
jgi:hypothetical protein